MKLKSALSLLLAGSLSMLNAGGSFAQDATRKPHVPLEKTIGQVTPTGPIPSLAVLNSDGAKLEGNQLTLTGISRNAIVFADRPARAAGHVTTDEFIKQWDEGPDSFTKDPPNATVSMLAGDGSDVSDAVVTLKSPKLDGTTLTFDVSVLEGSLAGANGPAALFIDHWGGWHGRGAWYGVGLATGAALGAAAMGASGPVYPAPYYPPYDPYYYPPAVDRVCPPGYWIGPWGHCRDTPYHGRLPNGEWQ
ncbi:hypothetical protein [Phyllobacterium sp. SYP-B3895]|uniref:hypothetical protein n=1 Tax=Phyllobacterium sp. SYP-B3895 TaxID=2663240 RepID=UPI001FEEC2BD|nr:hypothetical protein [Phyllobacterium sp. SYP-B3895]